MGNCVHVPRNARSDNVCTICCLYKKFVLKFSLGITYLIGSAEKSCEQWKGDKAKKDKRLTINFYICLILLLGCL